MRIPPRVTIVEVGPRDGLQNEPAIVSTADKIAFVDHLSAARLPVIEVGAFVSPRWVPAMAETGDVAAGIRRSPGTRYSALVPNVRGLERAEAAGVREVAIFGSASESFSRHNINQSIGESMARFRDVIQRATASGIRVRAYLSAAFGCPYEGNVPAARVAELTEALLDLGAFEVAVSDTIGVARPGQVWHVMDAITARVPVSRVALHFHDTWGAALANVLAALLAGVTTFDASCGGLGGCPYAPGASGNLATEDLVYLLEGLGVETGIEMEALVAASTFIAPKLAAPLPSRYLRAWLASHPPR